METIKKLSGNINPVTSISGNVQMSQTIYKNDYNDLKNKPSINGVLLKGNKTLEDLQITADYIPNLSEIAKTGDYNDLSNKPDIPTVDVNKKYVDDNLSLKVDKVGSKVLSDNNYTTEEKNKLAGLNYVEGHCNSANNTIIRAGTKIFKNNILYYAALFITNITASANTSTQIATVTVCPTYQIRKIVEIWANDCSSKLGLALITISESGKVSITSDFDITVGRIYNLEIFMGI